MLDPEAKRAREEAAKDKSESAQRERQILLQQADEKRKSSFTYRFKTKFGLENRSEKNSAQSDVSQ